MIFEAKAPTRVDLSGGTVDMWPLYLFHKGAQTVNAAIDLTAGCRVEERADDKLIIESTDLGTSETHSLSAPLPMNTSLQLVVRMVDFFKPYTGMKITTSCAAPPGSGLGGSSALAVALAGALDSLTGNRYTETQLLRIAQNLETQVIAVPSGVQDYYPAMFGGASSIHLGVEGITREALSINLEALQEHVVVCYTGKPHFSGTNNWEIFKAHIDGRDGVNELFAKICETTARMRIAVIEGDILNIARCLDEEWQLRKQLAPGVTTETIDLLMIAARQSGALAAKVCGAGGGGCVLFLVETGRRADVIQTLTQAGGQVLDTRLTDRGLRIEQIG